MCQWTWVTWLLTSHLCEFVSPWINSSTPSSACDLYLRVCSCEYLNTGTSAAVCVCVFDYVIMYSMYSMYNYVFNTIVHIWMCLFELCCTVYNNHLHVDLHFSWQMTATNLTQKHCVYVYNKWLDAKVMKVGDLTDVYGTFVTWWQMWGTLPYSDPLTYNGLIQSTKQCPMKCNCLLVSQRQPANRGWAIIAKETQRSFENPSR